MLEFGMDLMIYGIIMGAVLCVPLAYLIVLFPHTAKRVRGHIWSHHAWLMNVVFGWLFTAFLVCGAGVLLTEFAHHAVPH